MALLAIVPALPARAQNASIQAPGRVIVGQSFELRWTGPSAGREFISIDTVGAPESSYGHYVYANADQPAKLRAPDEPGRYAIRFHRGTTGYAVIASHALEVADTSASFDGLPPVAAGAPVTIAWRGPAWERDFISIDTVGASDRQYGAYQYARASPVTIRAPDRAGEYIVRYHLATTYRVIGMMPLTVGSVRATLTAPPEARAGATVRVSWDGPNERFDFISIDPENAPDREYGVYAYTEAGNPATLRVPDVPGCRTPRRSAARRPRSAARSSAWCGPARPTPGTTSRSCRQVRTRASTSITGTRVTARRCPCARRSLPAATSSAT
jgi:Ca-activated chloride channel family protein